jgi:hypothetical protein
MKGESRTSARRMDAMKKAADALVLRRAGATYADIAQQLGYTAPAGAQKAVERGLKATLQEPAESLRTLELDRLDRAQRQIWPAVLQGNLGAVDRLLKIMERRAKLKGLDAPVKSELTGKDGNPLPFVAIPLDLTFLSDDELDLYERILERMASARPHDVDCAHP